MNDLIHLKRLIDAAIVPTVKHASDVAFDLYAPEDHDLTLGIFDDFRPFAIPTGWAVGGIAPGYYLQLATKSGSVTKDGFTVQAGVIDTGYRGELVVVVMPWHKTVTIARGQQVAQAIIHRVDYPVSGAVLADGQPLQPLKRDERGADGGLFR